MKNNRNDEIHNTESHLTDVGTSPVAVPEDTELLSRIAAAIGTRSGLDVLHAKDPLAEPELPPLMRRDRATLLVQSPTRVYFYWTLRKDPYRTLGKILGNRVGNYRLYLRLLDLDTDRAEMHPAETDGNWWFNTDPGHRYRAEIGFFAPFRPFIRIAFSNTVQTPALGPSPRAAESAEWRIRADEFASILNAAGYRRDAAGVAFIGDDAARADFYAIESLAYILDHTQINQRFSADELAFALSYLASGYPLDGLRSKIGATLFAFLQQYADKWRLPEVIQRIREKFSPGVDEFDEEEYPAFISGASGAHLPGKRHKRPFGWFTLPREEALASPPRRPRS